MGRKKISEEEKKVKLSVSLSLSPENVHILKSQFVNLSSLINNLLKEYIESGRINKNNESLH